MSTTTAATTTNAIVAEMSFRDWASYVAHVEHAPANNGDAEVKRSSRRKRPDSWQGTNTWSEALELAKRGWPEIGAEVKLRSDSLFEQLSKYCFRPEPRYVDEGHVLDIGRWVTGEPEHWLAMEETETLQSGKRICKITYNQCASAGISLGVMQAKGATIVALVRLLDYCDIRTEIELISIHSSQVPSISPRVCYRVLLKTAAQDLDFDLVAFALAHPASFRRLGFACCETFPAKICDEFGFNRPGSYGYVSDLTPAEQNLCDVYVGSQMLGAPQWTNVSECQKWVLRQLANRGVALLPTVESH